MYGACITAVTRTVLDYCDTRVPEHVQCRVGDWWRFDSVVACFFQRDDRSDTRRQSRSTPLPESSFPSTVSLGHVRVSKAYVCQWRVILVADGQVELWWNFQLGNELEIVTFEFEKVKLSQNNYSRKWSPNFISYMYTGNLSPFCAPCPSSTLLPGSLSLLLQRTNSTKQKHQPAAH